MVNSTDHANIWVPSSSYNDGTIRGLFKAYFLVLIVFIVVVGNWSLRLWIKYKLLHGKTVLLTQTTGWIHGPGLFKAFFDLRKLPGGWLGWVMLLVTLLDLVGEFAVAITVRSQLRYTTRFYGRGMIMDPETLTSAPNPNWEAYRWTAEAQQNSYRNANLTNMADKHYGIYRMVVNDTNFMASPEDIIGYWSCTGDTSGPYTYDQAWKDPAKDQIYDEDIRLDLYNKGKLYEGYDFAMSNVSSYQDGELFNISAAVAVKELDDRGSKQMYVFSCQLKAKDANRTVESIARAINFYMALQDWVVPIRGALFPGIHEKASHPVRDIEVKLQYYFNSMIMVAGASESVTSPNAQGIEVGVVYPATRIPIWVLILCVLVWFIASFLASLAIYLYFAMRALAVVHDHKNKDGIQVSGKEINDNTPIGLLDWMAHAAYESRDEQKIPQLPQLKTWILSTTWHAGRRLAIVRKSEQGQVNPLRTPSSGSLGQFTPATQTNMSYFPGLSGKGDYAAVNSREVAY